MALTPEQRSTRASIAALARWASEDPNPAAKRAQRGLLEKFLREVDPDRKLPEMERLRRAECKRRAHMQRLALKSSKARAARKAASPSTSEE